MKHVNFSVFAESYNICAKAIKKCPVVANDNAAPIELLERFFQAAKSINVKILQCIWVRQAGRQSVRKYCGCLVEIRNSTNDDDSNELAVK